MLCSFRFIRISFRVTAESSEVACEWFKKLMQKTCSQRSVNDVFAWRFAKFAKVGILHLHKRDIYVGARIM